LTRLLLNFFYAQPVGDAVEALHYANGHHLAGAEVSVDYVTPPSRARSADRR
jgi:hypothetical protein